MAEPFRVSPLYTELSHVVADNDNLVALAARARPGQVRTFLFFGSVHYVLLGGVDHPLREYFPSIVGDDALPPDKARNAFLDFCRKYEDELAELIGSRLVQTNSVRRSLALKLAFVAIGRYVNEPVRLVDVGASAGINLRFDRFAYALGGRRFGNSASPVVIEADWEGQSHVPDLDSGPAVASAIGVDLNPIDLTIEDQRRWLQALVWGDNRNEWDLLEAATRVVAEDPPELRAGNAIDVCPALATELPEGAPRVVFTAATRMHVPKDDRDAFDAAILALGQNAPLYWVDLERPPDPDPRPPGSPDGAAVYLRRPEGNEELVAVAHTRQRWFYPGPALVAHE